MPFILENELLGAKLTGHDHFWRVIRELGAGGASFTISDVVGQTRAHKDSVGDFVRRLCRATPPIAERAGYREVKAAHWGEGKSTKAVAYRLLQSPRDTPSLRRDGTPGRYGQMRQQIWNILRGPQARAGITAGELAFLAETDRPVKQSTAAEYLIWLHAAGYLVVEEKAAHGRLTRYRLRPSMNTGPLAPKLLKTRVVYDPNRLEVMGSTPIEEVAP